MAEGGGGAVWEAKHAALTLQAAAAVAAVAQLPTGELEELEEAILALGDVLSERVAAALGGSKLKVAVSQPRSVRVEETAAVFDILATALRQLRQTSRTLTPSPLTALAGERWLTRICVAFLSAAPDNLLGSEAAIAQKLSAVVQALRINLLPQPLAASVRQRLTTLLLPLLRARQGEKEPGAQTTRQVLQELLQDEPDKAPATRRASHRGTRGSPTRRSAGVAGAVAAVAAAAPFSSSETQQEGRARGQGEETGVGGAREVALLKDLASILQSLHFFESELKEQSAGGSGNGDEASAGEMSAGNVTDGALSPADSSTAEAMSQRSADGASSDRGGEIALVREAVLARVAAVVAARNLQIYKKEGLEFTEAQEEMVVVVKLLRIVAAAGGAGGRKAVYRQYARELVVRLQQLPGACASGVVLSQAIDAALLADVVTPQLLGYVAGEITSMPISAWLSQEGAGKRGG